MNNLKFNFCVPFLEELTNPTIVLINLRGLTHSINKYCIRSSKIKKQIPVKNLANVGDIFTQIETTAK